jgi:hypothetical protein
VAHDLKIFGNHFISIGANTLHKVVKLVRITNDPIKINIVFKGSFPTSLAAIGAAISPPMISPATSVKGILFSKIKKVMELASTTKNSASQTICVKGALQI